MRECHLLCEDVSAITGHVSSSPATYHDGLSQLVVTMCLRHRREAHPMMIDSASAYACIALQPSSHQVWLAVSLSWPLPVPPFPVMRTCPHHPLMRIRTRNRTRNQVHLGDQGAAARIIPLRAQAGIRVCRGPELGAHDARHGPRPLPCKAETTCTRL